MDDNHLWLEEVIKEYEKRQSAVKILSVDERILVGEGENYMSQVKKLVVRLVRGDGETVTQSYILKQLPDLKNVRAFITDGGYYSIEFMLYRDILPNAENILNQKGIPEDPVWPKFITYTPYDKIILEDFTAQGYEMVEKTRGLDLDHCTLVMQNLGLYHALTLALKERHLLPAILLGQHYVVRNRKEVEIWFDSGIKKLIQAVEEWGDEWHETSKKLKKRLDSYIDDVVNLHVVKNGGLTVLAHGDCWINNLLFKYNVYTRKPILMRFIDFQVSCFASPALDIIYFLTGSPNMDVRIHHRQTLVRVYYDSLIFNMNRLDVNETRPMFEDLQSELKRMAFLNIHYMTMVLPVITLQKGEKMDFENIMEEMESAKARGDIEKRYEDMTPKFNDYTVSVFKMILKEAEEEGVI